MLPEQLTHLLREKNPDDADYAVRVVDALLDAAQSLEASDVHLLPQADGLHLSWRIDGVLQSAGKIPVAGIGQIVSRLKVLARLLTYEIHLPQEGRIPARKDEGEVRVSTFPTLFGEKAVIRRLSAHRSPLTLVNDLGLPQDVARELKSALAETSGAVLVVGPAGSGKTTTAYASLREIVHASAGMRSVASLEDPVEIVLPGVAQSQIALAAGFDLAAGLRSLVRQDPEVIFIGEMRDAATASVALQAALTGQLLLTTFHAGDAATALSRLVDMGMPSYVVRSAVRLVVAQRLLRRLCICAAPVPAPHHGMALPGERGPVGCSDCRFTGYAGRLLAAEFLSLDLPGIAEGVLRHADSKSLAATADAAGAASLCAQAAQLVATGQTSRSEALRVLGLSAAAAINAIDHGAGR